MGGARFSGQVCQHKPADDRGSGRRRWSGPRATSVLGVLILSVRRPRGTASRGGLGRTAS